MKRFTDMDMLTDSDESPTSDKSMTSDKSTTSVIEFPTNVEFQIQLDVMVAVLQRRPSEHSGYAANGRGYIRTTGKPVFPPPPHFTYVPPGLVDTRPEDTQANYVGWTLRSVSAALQEAGLLTNWPSNRDVNFGGPIHGFQVNHEAVWTVSLGPRKLLETREPEFDWVSVRIVSPVFNTTVIDTADQLGLVSQILIQNFITFAHSNSRLVVLVRPSESAVSLSYLKRIASLLWVIDPILSELHPPHCGPGSLPSLSLQFTRLAQQQESIDIGVQSTSAEILEDPWNYRLCRDRRPLPVLKSPGKLSEPQFGHGLGLIRSALTFEALLDLLAVIPVDFNCHPLLEIRGPVGAAYDFTRLNKSTGSSRGMLAFTQHCGTLDFDAIIHWAVVTTHLVALSAGGTFDFERTLQSLQHSVKAKDLSLAQTLHENGLEETAAYYQGRQGGLQPSELEPWPVLRDSNCADHSEPTLEQDPHTLNNPALLLNPSSRLEENPTTQVSLLGIIGESMTRWHCPSRIHNPDSRYTFGIEIEMLAPVLNSDRPRKDPSFRRASTRSHRVSQDPQPWDTRRVLPHDMEDRFSQMTKIMEGFNVAACSGVPCMNGGKNMSPFTHVKKQYIRDMNLLSTVFPVDYQVWMIHSDCSLTGAPSWKGYDGIFGIELASSIHRDTSESWEEILDTVSGLRRTVRLAVDSKCGFHVSVGAGDYDLSLAFLRKMASASFLADRLIFSLCDPRRKMATVYCCSLREQSNLTHHVCDRWRQFPILSDFAQHFPVDRLSVDDCAILKNIWLMTDIFELADSISYYDEGRSSVSFQRVRPKAAHGDISKSFYGAVEFRYLQGTLDPELILRFSQLMVAFFRFVDTAEPGAFQEFSSNVLECEDTWDYDLGILEKFLGHLNMSEDYTYWKAQVQQNRSIAPSIKEEIAMKKDNHDSEVSEEHLESITILPEVPDDKVESLRNNVCRRSKFASYAKEKPGDVVPKAILLDANTDLLTRTLAMAEAIDTFEGVSKDSLAALVSQSQTTVDVSKWSLRKRLEDLNGSYRASEPIDTDPITVEALVKLGVDALENSDIDNLFAAIDRHGKTLANPEEIQVSVQDLNSLIDLDDDHSDTVPFIFSDYVQVEGSPLQVSLTDEELRQLA